MGRRAELTACERALDRVELGTFHLIEVIGDPGVGKTRLLAEIAARAAGRGLATVRARATESERDVPFATVTGGLHEALLRFPPADLTDAERRLLAPLFPWLGPDDGAPVERHLVHRALHRLVEQFAEPLVVLHDDVHWIDEASTGFLGRLLRHPPNVPLLGVVAYRRRQAPPALLATLRDYAGDRLTTIELDTLTVDEAAELLGLPADSARLHVLHRDSGGNPFYLDLLVRHQTGDASRAGIAAELAGLSADARRVIDAASVAGEPFDTALAAQVAGLPEERVLAAVDELAARDLVQPDDADRPGIRLRFRHALVRTAVYERIGLGQRAVAHRRCADVLIARGARPGAIARHVAECAAPGDQRAVGTLRAAAIQAPPATAARWFQAALDLLAHDAPERLELLIGLAEAHGTSGRLRAGRAALHEVLTLLPPGSGELRAGAVAFCATLERLLGHHAEARAMLLVELGRLTPAESPAAVALLLELGSGALMRGEDGLAWVQRGLELARRLGLPHLEAAAAALQVQTQAMLGEAKPALRSLEEAVTLVDGLTDQRLTERLDAIVWLGWSEILLGELAAAARHLSRGRELAQRSGQIHQLPHLLVGLAEARVWLGDLAGASTLVDEAGELAVLLGSDELRWVVALTRSHVLTWRGEHEAAVAAAEETVRASTEVVSSWTPTARATLAVARLGLRLSEDRVAEAAAACEARDLDGASTMNLLLWSEALARAYAGIGRHDLARRWAVRADTRGCADVAVQHGLVLLAGAHADSGPHRSAALDRALAAAEEFDTAGARLLAGRARLLAGTLDDDRDRAVALLAEATGLFTGCGAAGLHDEAVRAQRQLGVRVPRKGAARDAGSPSGLSRRELDVARLVVRGLTNREIARRLFLSPRTVESHLAHTYLKLGIRSRAELAMRLAG